ncbi:MAG: hypothetical protein IT165_17735 [Bryobacterales bacterium]|nr:hypothetical protein [Bryobacterales bacterium]
MKKMVAAGLLGALMGASLLLALDEHGLTAKMKAAGDHMGGLRKAMQANSMADVATHAKAMAEAYEGLEGFFAARQMADGAKWSSEGLTASRELATAAQGGNSEAVHTAMGKLGATCKQCHAAHREKLADGTYKIK